MKHKKPQPFIPILTREANERRAKEHAAKRIPRESRRRKPINAEYREAARSFVKAARARGETCPVFAKFDQLPKEMQAMLTYSSGRKKSKRLNEIHHSAGRLGKLLMDQTRWRAISKIGHRAIHAFPQVAREHGWICEHGKWNQF